MTPRKGRPRLFGYNSPKRLESANTPESGISGCTFDQNGNVATRTSGGFSTTYTYDALDQLTGKT